MPKTHIPTPKTKGDRGELFPPDRGSRGAVATLAAGGITRRTIMTFLEQKIRDAHTAGRTALIPFVTAGFPTLDTFWGIIEELDANGADVIEIGVPFSDPVADGPVVEDASRRALEQGVSLNWIMDGLKQRAGNFKAGIVLMGYLNPFLQYGLERFAADAAQAGVSGCIVPDLPLDESAPVRTTLKAHGIDLIALVGQNTSEERMREYAAVSEGYVEETLRRARKAFNLPLALGFGLQHPDQLAAIPADIRPDAAVFGSALLKHLDKGNTAKAFLEVWTR